MRKEEITNLLEPYLKDDHLDNNERVIFITQSGLNIPVIDDGESEIYFLEESLQINQSDLTSLIAYSQIAMITIR